MAMVFKMTVIAILGTRKIVGHGFQRDRKSHIILGASHFKSSKSKSFGLWDNFFFIRLTLIY